MVEQLRYERLDGENSWSLSQKPVEVQLSRLDGLPLSLEISKPWPIRCLTVKE
jgi:hypothetical protein